MAAGRRSKKITITCNVDGCGQSITCKPAELKRRRAEHIASFHPGYVPPTGPKIQVDPLPPAA